jgi:predicted ATPase
MRPAMLSHVRLLNPSMQSRCVGTTEVSLKPGVNVFVGPNGSGKSTFLRAIADQADSEARTGGKAIASLTRDVEVPIIYHSSEAASGQAAHDQKLQDTVAGASIMRHGVGSLGNNYMSFGQRLLHLLAELQNITTPHIILLDEPEIALDFEAVWRFCAMCHERSGIHQFLIASHHPLFFTMKNANFVAFGSDPKYAANVMKQMRKRLAV